MKSSSRKLNSGLSSLPRAGALCAALAFMLVASAQAQSGPTKIVFASGPDETGTVQRLIDDFNTANIDEIEVQWRTMDRDNDTHRLQIVEELAAGSESINLIASDVIWTAELAKNRWVEDLTKRFYASYERGSLLGPALDSATYRLRIWGVPWYTDTGMLFYRKDLLAESGFAAPPATWSSLSEMAQKVMQDSGTKHGFVFQGADYEGGTANAAEFIWSAGGELVANQVTVSGMVVKNVTERDKVLVDSAAAARGLDIARLLVSDNVAPAAVANFREQEALDAFVAGDAVFLRSWPYAFNALLKAGFTTDQIGVAPLPAMTEGGASASCLGGWNLMINVNSSKAQKNAAWQLIRYLTTPRQQQRQAREAGLLPIVNALYEDEELVSSVPVIALGKKVLTSQLRARPMSPFYSEISSSIAGVFNRTLQGELTGAEAAEILDKELRPIVARN